MRLDLFESQWKSGEGQLLGAGKYRMYPHYSKGIPFGLYPLVRGTFVHDSHAMIHVQNHTSRMGLGSNGIE